MSKIVATQTYLISTVMGNIAVKTQLITDYDVEQIVRDKAASQARMVQMLNLSKELDGNPNLPPESVPSIFLGSEEVLDG